MNEGVKVNAVLEALSAVQEPELKNDLVSLGMIKDLMVEGGRVEFTIELTTPACPLRDQIKAEATRAVENVAWVSSVKVHLSANVPTDSRTKEISPNTIRNVIAIASGKGGVGKSTIAVNMAVALAQAGARVGLLDADIYGPNVPTMMGVDRIPPMKEKLIVPAEAYGVKIMSIGFLVSPDQPLIWRGPMLHSVIQQFINDVEWGELDYLVVDLPPGTGDAQLSLTQSIPLSGGVIVTLPQKVSLEDARRGLQMFRAMEVPVLGIIENMSYLEMPDGTKVDVFGHGGGAELAKETGVPLIGTIPLDPSVREGGDTGVPIIISNPDSKVSLALIKVAEDIAAKVSVQALEGKETLEIDMID
ncbi:MAG: chromosome partitioning protein [Chloroflexi bacterium RBG_16_48_8]|nr:MAG: chromosome partitioning protein [Chloroflexi bacterium RBG_16_48_8]